MPSRKKSRSVPLSAADVANIAKSNAYIQRLIEDAKLRANLRAAFESTRSAYSRVSNGKTPGKALLQDKKLQRDLRQAAEAVKEATTALTKGPKKRARRGLTFGRTLMIAGLGTALALVGSEKLRSKVLDTLFGKEEEFEYTPPTTPGAATQTTPVGAS